MPAFDGVVFEANSIIPDGDAALWRDGEVIWIGPVSAIPDREMLQASVVYVSPAVFDRLDAKLKATGKGIPLDDYLKIN